MSLDLMFPTHNRLAFVQATFLALRDNTDWDRVERFHIIDDHSTDGTLEFLSEAIRTIPCASHFTSNRFGGPVTAMNHVLDRTDANLLAKVDSDCVVCPGWLEAMLSVIEANPGLDALGMEPGFASFVQPAHMPRTYKPARWIGGIGVFKTSVFARHRPNQSERFFGLTAHWRRFANTGWVDPDLPVFLLDHLPFEPWQSLARDYLRQGWSREWPDKYPAEFAPYWSWWLEAGPSRKMETAAR